MNQAIADGTYRARIVDFGIVTTQKGDPKVFADFQIEGLSLPIRWSSGFYTPSGSEITVNNLITMGLTSAQNIPIMAEGLGSKALDVSQIYEITIENKPHWKYTETFVPEVRYINREGQGKSGVRLDSRVAASKLSALNLGEAFKSAAEKRKDVTVTSSSDNIPF